MTRRTSVLALIGSAVLLNAFFACAARSEEIARVEASGVVVVDRDGRLVRVTIPTASGRIVVEIDADFGPGDGGGPDLPPPPIDPPSDPPDPEPPTASDIIRGVLRLLDEPDRASVVKYFAIAIDAAITGLKPHHTDAILSPFMATWVKAKVPGNDRVVDTAVDTIADTLPELPGATLSERLTAMRAALGDDADVPAGDWSAKVDQAMRDVPPADRAGTATAILAGIEAVEAADPASFGSALAVGAVLVDVATAFDVLVSAEGIDAVLFAILRSADLLAPAGDDARLAIEYARAMRPRLMELTHGQ